MLELNLGQQMIFKINPGEVVGLFGGMATPRKNNSSKMADEKNIARSREVRY